MSANIYVLPPGFSDRLRSLRKAAYMTQSDLAERAGIAPRSVHEIESGRRERVMAKTVMLLAEALDLTVDELLETGTKAEADSVSVLPTRVRLPGYLWKVMAAVAGCLVIWFGLPILAPVIAGRAVEVDEQAGTITARDDLLGGIVWEQSYGHRVWCWRYAPWNDGVLLVGLDDKSDEGGRLVALDVRSGKECWSFAPDREKVASVFGPASVEGGGFDCREIHDADLDGDGHRELIAQFTHEFWYPAGVWVLDREGRLQSTYLNRGHLYSIHIGDLDDDGLDEILCAGTNNAPLYNGPTVFILDDTHRTGAAVDPVTSPSTSVADTSLVRIVLPNWPAEAIAALDPGCRSEAGKLGLYSDGGRIRISATVGCRAVGMSVLTMDQELQPLVIQAGDMLRAVCQEAGVDTETLGRAWVDSHVRFEEGVRFDSPLMPITD